MSEQLKVTSIEELKQMAGAQIVALPGWQEGRDFIVKLKRPSLLSLSAKGLLPNALLSAAEEIFTGKKSSKGKTPDMKDIGAVMDVLVGAALVKPTYDQIKEAGIELTDEQITEIFNFTQKGVTQLKLFREEQKRLEDNSGSEGQQGTSVGGNGN